MSKLVDLHDADAYFLDDAHESSELDATSYLTLRLHGDPNQVHEAIDAKATPRCDQELLTFFIDGTLNGKHQRQARMERLIKMADAILLGLSKEEAGGLIWVSVTETPRILRWHAEVCAYMAFEDSVFGGGMLPFRKRARVRTDGTPTKRIMRRLNSPKFIRRYVRQDPETKRVRGVIDRMMNRLQIVPTTFIRNTTEDIQKQLDDQRRARALAYRQQVSNLSTKDPENRKATRDRHKMLKRAARFAVTVLGKEQTSDLVHSRVLRLVGDQLEFHVRCRNLSRCGHGGLDLAVASRDGKKLADLCMFYPDTPAIDQVTALALDIAGHEELDVLSTANVIAMTDEGRQHPLLAKRHQPSLPARSNCYELNKEYVNRTYPIWLDATCVQAFPDWAVAKRAFDCVTSLQES